MTRFARRATALTAAVLAAPLSFVLVATTPGPQVFAAGAPVAVSANVEGVQAEVFVSAGFGAATTSAFAADDVTFSTVAKKKKKKTKPAPKPTTPTTPSTPTKPANPATGYEALETQVVTLTNNYRVANGCGALRIDSRLVAAARAHSTDMVTKNFFSHTGSDGSDFVAREVRAGYTTGASAENIAWGYRSAQDVVTGWINSPGHKANILNCGSTAVGVGLAYKADGTPYWTQDFGRV